MSRRSAPTRTRPRPMPAPRRRASRRCSAAVPSATILRPSLMFGPEDQFTNRFAALARMSPVLPLIGARHAGCSRPMSATSRPRSRTPSTARPGPGAIYELGGPEVLTMREIMEIICGSPAQPRADPLPFGLADCRHFPAICAGALKLTPDQVAMLQSDNVVSDAAKSAGLTLEGLGITPEFDASDRATISLALPRRRAVSAQERVELEPSW